MKKILVLISMLFILVSANAYASWEYMGNDSSGNQEYILPESSQVIKFTPKQFEWTVQVKEIYGREGKSDLISNYALKGVKIKGIELADYEIKTYHFKAWKDQVGFRVDNSYGYNNNGYQVCTFKGWYSFEPFESRSLVGLFSYRALNYLETLNNIDYFKILIENNKK